MILAACGVAQQHDAQVIRRNTGRAQHGVFGNRVILAVAEPARQRRERRRP